MNGFHDNDNMANEKAVKNRLRRELGIRKDITGDI